MRPNKVKYVAQVFPGFSGHGNSIHNENNSPNILSDKNDFTYIKTFFLITFAISVRIISKNNNKKMIIEVSIKSQRKNLSFIQVKIVLIEPGSN